MYFQESHAPTKEEVLEALFAVWSPQQISEEVAPDKALGRIASKDVLSCVTLPVVRSSQLDGYAIRSESFVNGTPDTSQWAEGIDYVRADTGDDFDDRFDTVVRVEAVSLSDDGKPVFPAELTLVPGMGINSKGSTVKTGDVLISAGLPLRPYDLGLLAMGAVTKVPVVRKPKIAFIPTGSELVAAGTLPKRGQTVDSGSVIARFSLEELGAEPLMHPPIKDDKSGIEAALDMMLAQSDIVIIGGGSSKGSEDFSAALLKERGELICHGVAAGPGRPLCVALIEGKLVINSSGPMLALYHQLEWLISPIVARALGVPARKRPTVSALLEEGIELKPLPEGTALQMFHRMRLTKDEAGYHACPIKVDRKKGSGIPFLPSGQFFNESDESTFLQGSILEVEALYPLEFL